MALLMAAWAIFCPAFHRAFFLANAQTSTGERILIPRKAERIAGTVVNAKTGSALTRVRVTITEARDPQSFESIITGDDGRFEFQVMPGKYALQGAKRGYISAGYNQHEQFSTAIVTGAGLDTESLTLRLPPHAVLTGRILDESGDPVRHAQVTVYRENRSQGISRIWEYRNAATDDQGRYEVTPLDEGTYFVSAKASPWYALHPPSEGAQSSSSQVNSQLNSQQNSQIDPSLDVAYPITYYGDVTESDDAAPIPVRGGDRLEADIHLSPVPAMHITLRISQEGANQVFPRLQKPAFEGFDSVNGDVQRVAPGVYELTGVAPGRYSVVTSDSSGEMKEPAEVNLSSGEVDLSSARLASKITASVQIEGAATLPSPLQIGMREAKGRTNFATVDGKGEANFSNVVAGKYDLMAWSQSQRYSVIRIMTEAGVISGRSLTVVPGTSPKITLSLVGGSVTVEGFARRDGKPASGAMIVLVPRNPDANRDRFRRDQSDLDGSFSLQNVVPGSYSIIAIADGWDLDWAAPTVIGAYSGHGQAVDVPGQSPTTMHLADAVEVQSK